MLATTGMLLGALAVICVMLEATGPAAAFGAVAYWMTVTGLDALAGHWRASRGGRIVVVGIANGVRGNDA
jgi:hypothetical protein